MIEENPDYFQCAEKVSTLCLFILAGHHVIPSESEGSPLTFTLKSSAKGNNAPSPRHPSFSEGSPDTHAGNSYSEGNRISPG
jgi:hypothetical protein